MFVNPQSYQPQAGQPQAGQLEEVDTAATLLIKYMETKAVGFKLQEPSGVPVFNVHITCLVKGLVFVDTALFSFKFIHEYRESRVIGPVVG